MEPAEPDNINWQGLDTLASERIFRQSISFAISGGILYLSYLLTDWVHSDYPEYFALVIAGLDTVLPPIFMMLLSIERHLDEDDKQDSILIRLFLARLLNPIILPFIFTSWKGILSEDYVDQILQIQV
jgi:hypothetical protein